MSIYYIDIHRYMIFPVKSAVRPRTQSLASQVQKAQDRKQAMAIDPLLKLAEAREYLGDPCYSLLRRWIADGKLKVWRIGRGHIKVRLSELEKFRASGEMTNGE
jgi:hypothetical protein